MDCFEKVFEKILEENKNKNDFFLDRILSSNEKLIIFGAGALGQQLAASLVKKGYKLTAFCDNFKAGYDERFGVPIVSPEQAVDDYSDAVVAITVSTKKYRDAIYKQVIRLGFPAANVYLRHAGCELLEMDELLRHYDGYKWAYDFFSDEVSKNVILQRIRGYLHFEEMSHAPSEAQYFDNEVICVSDEEVFIDGGCYTGDTVLQFLKRTNNRYRHIYGFEPDPINREKAKANLVGRDGIEIVNKGLWDKECELQFVSAGASSKVVESSGDGVSVTSLDTFFSGMKDSDLPTFIKLDIEGSEKKALLGAKHIIGKVRPKLAVCAYHRPEDIYSLSRLIMDLGRYRLKLRHYTEGSTETVIYAL